MDEEVTLARMLEARENRVFRQRELLARYGKVLICFTMNIPGPVKNSSLIRRGFDLGEKSLLNRLEDKGIPCIYRETIHESTGNEGFYVVDSDSLAVKRAGVELEDETELGRLFDIDVIKPDGEKVERTELGLPERRCLICMEPAKECARSRKHTVLELQEKTRSILRRAVDEADAAEAAGLACKAVLYEVSVTPKPGLVDRRNSGSHRDMDFFTFMDSESVLWPYFDECVKIGRRTSALAAQETMPLLRRAGQGAEREMFRATGGVNTHKGAVFSLGILCGALGRLPREEWKSADAVLDECAAITRGIVESDLKDLTEKNARTAGQRLYLAYGITGVRGQMEEGLPAVRNFGLPVLREGISLGLSVNDAGCAALLALMAGSVDTNLIARSSMETWKETVAGLRDLLSREPYPNRETLEALDDAFIKRNLSPGGSADLLAICFLLYFLEKAV